MPISLPSLRYQIQPFFSDMLVVWPSSKLHGSYYPNSFPLNSVVSAHPPPTAHQRRRSLILPIPFRLSHLLPNKQKTQGRKETKKPVRGARARMELCHCMEQLRSQPSWVLALVFLGSFICLRFLVSTALWLYVSFFRPAKNLRKYGSWAVITGATDGIGKAFAFQLARKGLNLVLVGRNPDKLRDTSAAIREKQRSVKVETVVVDFSGDLVEGAGRLKEKIEGLDVGLLVNNAGISYPYARYFHELDEELLGNLVKVNVEGVTRVTHAVLPGMLKRKKGAIVNIGSGAAIVIPSDPLYAVYAATKAYIDQFSRCLYVEYKKSGIDVQCQVPLYVATKMASIRRSSFWVPSSDAYVRAALRCIGYEPRCTPYWPHSFLWCLASMLPEAAIDKWRIGFCMNIRRRGQLKDSRKQA